MAECDLPGASVAEIAKAHGINANIVHGWRKLARRAGATPASMGFVPVTVISPAPRSVAERSIDIELRRGAITIKLTWPTSAAMDLSA